MNLRLENWSKFRRKILKLLLPVIGYILSWEISFDKECIKEKRKFVFPRVGAFVLPSVRFCKNRNSRLSFCAAQLRHTVYPLLPNVSLRFIIGETTRAPFSTALSSSDDSPKSTYSVRNITRPVLYIHRRFPLTLVHANSLANVVPRFRVQEISNLKKEKKKESRNQKISKKLACF